MFLFLGGGENSALRIDGARIKNWFLLTRSHPFFAPLALIGALGPKNLYIGDITGRKHFLHKVRHVSRLWALGIFSASTSAQTLTTDDGIVSLSNIDHLDLRNCNRVSPAAICRVVQCSPSMDWLYFYECKHLVPMDIVFGRLHQNVDGILKSHKELMRNLLEWVENQKQVPREVFDVSGVEPPNSDSESDSDQGTYRSSSSEDYF